MEEIEAKQWNVGKENFSSLRNGKTEAIAPSTFARQRVRPVSSRRYNQFRCAPQQHHLGQILWTISLTKWSTSRTSLALHKAFLSSINSKG